MEKNKSLIDVLNDLVKINNDRIQGYDRAIRETKPNNTELMQVLDKMKLESVQLKEVRWMRFTQQDRGKFIGPGWIFAPNYWEIQTILF